MNRFKEIFDKRFNLLVLGILLIGMLIGYMTGQQNYLIEEESIIYASSERSPVVTKGTNMIVVQEGDTLWGIALTYFPAQSPLEAIEHMKALNQLTGDTIRVGQRLRIQ